MAPPLYTIGRRYKGIPLTRATKTGAIKDALADTAGSNLLGLGDADGSPLLGTTTNGGSTATAAETVVLNEAIPEDWVPGTELMIALRAKVSAARTVSATVDLLAKLYGDTLGSDICATDAQALATSYRWHLFNITTAGLSPGDILALTPTLSLNDTGGNTNGAGSITQIRWEYGARI